MLELIREIESLENYIVGLRRDFHRHPELAFQENWTGRRIADELEKAGAEVVSGIGGTGVVGLIRGANYGKTIGLRADMDALPITEVNTGGYSSQQAGLMHACGHDGHMAVALGLARALGQLRHMLHGNVKFIFQPAEEIAGGAQAMIQAGVLKDPEVNYILGNHLWNILPVGSIGVRPGPVFASVDVIDILIKGKGGHGAMPHLAINPISISSHVMVALEELFDRERARGEPLAFSFGTMNAGTVFNTIPDEAKMSGTLRCLDRKLRSSMIGAMEKVTKDVVDNMGGTYSFKTNYPCPTLVNDSGVTLEVRKCAESLLGGNQVLETEPVMIADDMAYFLENVPGCYFLVGSGRRTGGLAPSHHSSDFDFDESSLQIGAKVLGVSIISLLESKPKPPM